MMFYCAYLWDHEMAKGDHIKVKRRGYFHHGIEVGDGTVIHFSGEPGQMDNAEIQQVTTRKFLKGGTPGIVLYPKAYVPDTVVKRAESRIGEIGYHLVFNNCEHFARWCKIGEIESKQVKRVATITQAAGEKLSKLSEKSSGKAGKVLGVAGKAMTTFSQEVLEHKPERPAQEIEGPMVEIEDKYLQKYSRKGFWQKLKHYAKTAGEEVVSKSLQLYFAAQEPDTPKWAKVTVYGALGYFISPVDAIPDFTPIVGYSDDLGILIAAIATVAMYITPVVKEKAQQKMKDWFE